jgi:predicted Fe-Mo cluster-binding NifX family protein
MRVAVTSTGKAITSPVDPRFGRAQGFVIVDVETGEARYFDNARNAKADQGAGIQAAKDLSREGVECVITGHCGPRAFRTLSASGLKVAVGAGGTVSEAVGALKAGDLEPAAGPDVAGHWGVMTN